MQEPAFTCYGKKKIPGENIVWNNLIAKINLQIGFARAIEKNIWGFDSNYDIIFFFLIYFQGNFVNAELRGCLMDYAPFGNTCVTAKFI
jgi:hypothetical protein